MSAHHEESADALLKFILRSPRHGAKWDPLYVKTSGYLAFADTLEESIDLVQTTVDLKKEMISFQLYFAI